jgi:hypothetical protein
MGAPANNLAGKQRTRAERQQCTRPTFRESYEISDAVTPCSRVSDVAILRLSGFVASYAKILLASAAGIWAATDAQTASTLANNVAWLAHSVNA